MLVDNVMMDLLKIEFSRRMGCDFKEDNDNFKIIVNNLSLCAPSKRRKKIESYILDDGSNPFDI